MENLDNNNQENLSQENLPNPEIIQIIAPQIAINEKTKKPFWKKFRSFATDIAIVVIGVTLSTLFNDQITSYNQQREVKKFLFGLKADFVNDIKEMKQDKMDYERNRILFTYITSLKKDQIADNSSIDSTENSIMFILTRLLVNDGRYEGFKSAGKMNLIDNESLQNDILDLYQEDIKSLLLSTDRYIERKVKFFTYLESNGVRETNNTTNFYTLLTTDKCYYLCKSIDNVQEIVSRYDICINKMKKIIFEIDKKYK